tara:strand:+ start:244 stop:444 length:201 start_codon:yes stop_codon:yes gene_type:complete
MATNIDIEIDKLLTKTVDQFKTRLKKIIIRHQKLVLKQYIASQKQTLKTVNKTKRKTKTDKSKSNE